MSKKRKLIRNGGFTLVELVVTISVLVIASVVLIASYTNVMEKQRMESDMASLEKIDAAVNHILLRDDAFQDVKPYLQETNKLEIHFAVDKNGDGASVLLKDAVVGDNYNLALSCTTFYKYLSEYVGNEIVLKSIGYKSGEYVVYVTFNITQVSDVREPIVTNDTFVVANSGNEFLLP